MKAIVLTKYGSPDGLQLTNIEKPTPKDNEVLIRVRTTTVTAEDAECLPTLCRRRPQSIQQYQSILMW